MTDTEKIQKAATEGGVYQLDGSHSGRVDHLAQEILAALQGESTSEARSALQYADSLLDEHSTVNPPSD